MSIETINAGDTIAQLRTKLINNFDYLAALLNGNLDGTNFQYLGGAGHGNLSYIYEPLHSDKSVIAPDGDDLEEALDTTYERIDSIKDVGESIFVYLDSKTDETTYEVTEGDAFNQVAFPKTEITIPPDAAPSGIIVFIRLAEMRTWVSTPTTVLKLRLNGVDLTGSRWNIRSVGGPPYVNSGPGEHSHHAAILVSDGWDSAVENKIRMGLLTGAYFRAAKCTLTVFALR